MPPRIIEKSSYIKDLVTGTKMEFQMMPDVSDSKAVNWNHIEIIGRSHPLLGYASSGPRTISFTLGFFATQGGGGGGSVGDPMPISKVSSNLKFLLSLAYPDYDGGVKPPHLVMVRLGSQVMMKGVVTDVTNVYNTLWNDNLPMQAQSTVTIIEAEPRPVNYSYIRS
jgi:hypothetical protein